MTKILDPKFQEQDIPVDDVSYFPELEERIIQTLSRMMAYDRTNNIWRRVNVDASGNLGLSIAAAAAASGAVYKASPGVSATVLVNTNPDRKGLTIFNFTNATCFLGFSSSVTTNSGLPLPGYASIEINNYVGAVYGIATGTLNYIYTMETY